MYNKLLEDPQEADGHLDWGPMVAPGVLKDEHKGAGLARSAHVPAGVASPSARPRSLPAS